MGKTITKIDDKHFQKTTTQPDIVEIVDIDVLKTEKAQLEQQKLDKVAEKDALIADYTAKQDVEVAEEIAVIDVRLNEINQDILAAAQVGVADAIVTP